MKRFSFRLDRVLDWKTVVSQQEQLALDSLNKQHDEMTVSLLRLDERITGLSQDTPHVANGHELAYSAQARFALVKDRVRTESQRASFETRIAKQQEKVRGAETERRLIDKLKDRSYAEWSAEMSREMETTASDLYLGGWSRRQESLKDDSGKPKS
jgi:hypothetical protein